jgi:hypothetical protein
LEKRANCAAVFFHITAEHDVAVVADQAEHVGCRQNRETKIAQPKIPDNFRVQQAHDVGKRGGAKARSEFLGNCCTADQRTALEYQHFSSRLREIGAAGEAIVTGTDDNGINFSCSHRAGLAGSNSSRFILCVIRGQ